MNKKIIRQEMQNFIDEDKLEPFSDRNYYDYMIFFYEALLRDVHITSLDKAVFDFAHFGNEIGFFKTDNIDYKKGFNILMEYFDSISDEQKSLVSEKLKEVGL